MRRISTQRCSNIQTDSLACGDTSPAAGPQLTLGLLRRLTFRDARAAFAERRKTEVWEELGPAARLRLVLEIVRRSTRHTLRLHRIVEFWKSEVRETNFMKSEQENLQPCKSTPRRSAFRALHDLCAELQARHSPADSSEDQRVRDGVERIMALSQEVGNALRNICDRHHEHLSGLTEISADLSRLSLRAQTVLSRFKVAVKHLLNDASSASEVHSARRRELRRESSAYGRRLSSKERFSSKERHASKELPFADQVQTLSSRFEDILKNADGIEQMLVKEPMAFVLGEGRGTCQQTSAATPGSEQRPSPISQRRASAPEARAAPRLRTLLQKGLLASSGSTAITRDAPLVPQHGLLAAAQSSSSPSVGAAMNASAKLRLPGRTQNGEPHLDTSTSDKALRNQQWNPWAGKVQLGEDVSSKRRSGTTLTVAEHQAVSRCTPSSKSSSSRCNSAKSLVSRASRSPSPSCAAQAITTISGRGLKLACVEACAEVNSMCGDDIEEHIVNDEEHGISKSRLTTPLETPAELRRPCDGTALGWPLSRPPSRNETREKAGAWLEDPAPRTDEKLGGMSPSPLCINLMVLQKRQAPSHTTAGHSRPPAGPTSRPRSAVQSRSAGKPFCARSVVSMRPSTARPSSANPSQLHSKRQESVYELVGQQVGGQNHNRPTVSLSPRRQARSSSPRPAPQPHRSSPWRVGLEKQAPPPPDGAAQCRQQGGKARPRGVERRRLGPYPGAQGGA